MDKLGVIVHPAETRAEAETCLDRKLDLIVVCYVFDELRPYQFVGRVRHEGVNMRTPIILVRALPVPLGESQEWEIRHAYHSIGVDEFCNYSEMVHEKGTAQADEAFRACALRVVDAAQPQRARRQR